MDSWLYLYGPPELFVTLSDREDKEMGITSVARESYHEFTVSQGGVEQALLEYLRSLGICLPYNSEEISIYWGDGPVGNMRVVYKCEIEEEKMEDTDKFYVVIWASSGSGGLPIPREIEFCDEASIKRWLKHEYASCPNKLGDDLQRGRLYIYRGRKVTPKIRKVTIDEIDLSW
jgi:hypothetical protein